MKRYLLLAAMLGFSMAVWGCETKATKAPGGPSDANQQNAAEPAAKPASEVPPPTKDGAKTDMPADPFATAPASPPSLGIPELKPPEIAAPKIDKKAEPKPEAKK